MVLLLFIQLFSMFSNGNGIMGTKANEEDGPIMTMDKILNGDYSPRSFNGTWISDDQIQYFDQIGNLRIHNVTSETSKILINGITFRDAGLAGQVEVTLSSDKKYALIGHSHQTIFRHSFRAKYEIHRIGTKEFESLAPESNTENRTLQLVQWSPTKNAVAFVYNNDVYYRPTATSPTVPLTFSGSPKIFNGVTDWVYEEEMFGTYKALWFSTEGSCLAYATFNDTQVSTIEYPIYGPPGFDPFQQFQYPHLQSLAYPKAGTPNPVVTISVVDLALTTSDNADYKTINLNLTADPDLSHYIGRALWATNTKLLVLTLNRAQNESQTVRCVLPTGNCTTIFSTQEPHGWIDMSNPKVSRDGTKLILLNSVEQEDAQFYKHIALADISGTYVELVSLTKGTFSVDSIVGWDETKNRIFFMATGYNQTSFKATPSQSHLYMTALSAHSDAHDMICLTCALNSNGDKCNFNYVEMSPKFNYFIHSCGDSYTVPEISIRRVDEINNKATSFWEKNEKLENKIKALTLPVIQDYEIPIAQGRFVAKARLWIPRDYKPHLKYPLLVDVYAGPGSQQITDDFKVDWGTYLVSRNVIYASIDARGSGRQSDDLTFEVNRQLGTVEIEDQIAVTKWLINNINIIDHQRTAIWGWSYGGFATATIMGKDVEGIFKCGISVAPVTSWVLYDSIYTERYMGQPNLEDNLAGYNESDVTHYIENFRTKKFYLIHGCGDDNVHYQQTSLLSRALEDADILFRQQSYPDEDHYLENVLPHLYHSMEDFLFEECF